MESQERLDKGIGTRDIETLKPAKVKVVEVGLEPVKFGNKTNEKVVLSCKHPDRDDLILISKVKIEKGKDKLKTSGLWFTLDEDENIQKGSALANFLAYAGIEKPSQFKDKEFDTITDEGGFLILKAY